VQLPKANKKLGQHFLTDVGVQEMITSDHLAEAQAIVEVGPGPAVLTSLIVKKLAENEEIKSSTPFWVMEKDSRFTAKLREILPENAVHVQDALQCNWFDFFQNKITKELLKQADKVWLVANLPYNISVPLYLDFVRCPQFHFLTLMFQKEVGEKLVGYKKKNNTNSLWVITQNYFTVKTHLLVPPQAFTPPPEVESIFVSLIRREQPVIGLEEFSELESFLRQIFSWRRKQLGTILKNIFHEFSWKEYFESTGIDPVDRPEVLSFDQMISLFYAFQKVLKIKEGRQEA
jgi:16S rRNA (adenine1518-N6/adenine1519-N6)-dimethyltransferase